MALATAEDPLLPWLRSIRQLKQAHSDDKLRILPYVSDCYQKFRDDVRYRNDPRFLRVCVQLADCSSDPLEVLAELDKCGIGHTHALFYEAYATCLEAKKRFGDANNVYKRGLACQAYPTEKLTSSFKAFRDRMDARTKRKQDKLELQGRRSCGRAEEGISRRNNLDENRIRVTEARQGGNQLSARFGFLSNSLYTAEGTEISFEELRMANSCKTISSNRQHNEVDITPLGNPVMYQNNPHVGKSDFVSFGEETVKIRNFAAEVVTGKEKDVEDARHHGLVDPTINTKEALEDILSMFRQPLNISKGMGKPSKSFVSVGVSASEPLLEDNVKQLGSPKAKKQKQPMEFTVFQDDEESESQFNTNKPAAIFPLLQDENKKGCLLDSSNAQRSELPVYRDDEKEHLFHLDNIKNSQRNDLFGGLHARSSELFVFRDDELEDSLPKPRTKLAEKGKGSLGVDSLSERSEIEANRQQNSGKGPNDSEFFVFKDDEPSEEEDKIVFKVYGDEDMGNKAHHITVAHERQKDPELLVFKDDPV